MALSQPIAPRAAAGGAARAAAERRLVVRAVTCAGDGCDTRVALSSGRVVQTVYDAATDGLSETSTGTGAWT